MYMVHIATVAPSHQRLHFGDFINPLTNESAMMSLRGPLGTRMLQSEILVAGTRVNVGDLQPRTMYSITVAAATSEGIGPFSTPVTVSTLESGTRVDVCVCVRVCVHMCVCMCVYACVCVCVCVMHVCACVIECI